MPKDPHAFKTALITGAAKRLGRQLALGLAQKGYSIALHYHTSQKQAAELAATIRKNKVPCETFAADLANSVSVKSLLPRVIEKLGPVAVLVNNASIFNPSSLINGDLKDLDQQFAVNFKAPYLLISEFAKASQTGSIINILDTNVAKRKISHFNYLLSKKALASLTEMSAIALAPRIRVNAIAPGLILPPEGKTSEYLRRLSHHIPLKRKGSPENIVQAALFLLENDFINGQTIFVDGAESLA